LVGNTPQRGIQLPAGKYQVTLINPTMNLRQTFQVNIASGKAVTKIVNLQ